LHCIAYWDTDIDLWFVFLTNNFNLPASAIAYLYKSRWQVELCFKWVKQFCVPKAFYGASDNAVKVQVWVVIGICVFVTNVKKEFGMEQGPDETLQILRLVLFNPPF
jgi:IS4 transposase